MFTDDETYPLFVYGSLRRESTHFHKVRPFITERIDKGELWGYQMWSYGRFPGISAWPNAPLPVQGEIYYWKPSEYIRGLVHADNYEGVDWFFQRKLETVKRVADGKEDYAWVYVLPNEVRRQSAVSVVSTNDWMHWLERVEE